MDDLIIFDDHNNQLLKESSRSKTYQLYIQISSLKSFTRTYRRRYTKENFIELNHIQTLFPNSESTVRKALKIPLGTWSKLLNEIKMMDQRLRVPKCRHNLSSVLKAEEKEFIKDLIKPPTHPLTVNWI